MKISEHSTLQAAMAEDGVLERARTQAAPSPRASRASLDGTLGGLG